MAERFMIYAAEPIASALMGYEQNRSGRLNQIADAYRDLIADNMPAFSVADWRALLAVLEHANLSDMQSLRLAWAVLADNAAAAHLAERVRGFTDSQLMALRELHWRWQNALDTNAAPFDAEQRLRDLGARIAA